VRRALINAAWLTSPFLALSIALADTATSTPPLSVGLVVQEDNHVPTPWRALTPAEKVTFDLGYAVFNTSWAPANAPAGRTDGIGPLFNSQSCDSCHNSRRRGRGPRGDGDAPNDLVMQLGRVLPDGRVERGTSEYGRVLNTAAIRGFAPEASITIRYKEQVRTLPDGAVVRLRRPQYLIANLRGSALPADTVLMPRMPPSIYGVGLLERVPESALVALAADKHNSGRVSRLQAPGIVGRFGWQATEPTVASQTASALAREMGLTSNRIDQIDCGQPDRVCARAPSGGMPEVEPALFDALLFFQDLHSVPVAREAPAASREQHLFDEAGCSRCHASTLPVETAPGSRAVIRPYTDLLLHELGEGIADRDLSGNPVRSEWRTAPLWGMSAAVTSNQPIRLLHDGRARSVEEAILWHSGEADAARERFERLAAAERRRLVLWIEQL